MNNPPDDERARLEEDVGALTFAKYLLEKDGHGTTAEILDRVIGERINAYQQTVGAIR